MLSCLRLSWELAHALVVFDVEPQARMFKLALLRDFELAGLEILYPLVANVSRLPFFTAVT
ncbi:hypothetical protein CJF43_14120 [Pseudomonas fragi]|uniref:Uncharacterized protein n=1 Tax=Pseudomonas fragi TaxID=296 RepID=A0A266LSK6_PSEFR|nr:hypothetical protein CJF43_14120 [Pseudomonas fragi]